jgi:uncharacterized protein (TIGR00725 family)
MKKNYKIAIFGSSTKKSSKINKLAEHLGSVIAKKGHILITGACSGIPRIAAKAAFETKGRVMGFSPTTSEKEHKNNNEPCDYFSKLIFVPKNYRHIKNRNVCYKYRNIESVLAADKVIIINGQYGTLNEFILAYEFGKEIGVLTNTGGTADLCKIITKKLNKKTGAKIYYHSNPNKLLLALGI